MTVRSQAVRDLAATSATAFRRSVFWPHVLCAVFIVLWLDVGIAAPWMAALPGAVKIGVLGLWLVLAAVRSASFVGAVVANAWPLALFLLVAVLFAAEIAQSVQYVQGIGYLLIAFALMCFYVQDRFRTERLIVMTAMLVDLAITGARTVLALQTDPLVSRYLATTEENRTAIFGERSFLGLGGYSYAYSLAGIVIVLLHFAVRTRYKITLTIVAAVGMGVLLELAFTTAVVLVVVMGAAFLVQDVVRHAELRIFIGIAAVLGWVAGVYSFALDAVARLEWLNAAVAERLGDLSRSLSGESLAGSDFGKRVEFWGDSVDIVLSTGPLGLAGAGAMNQETGGHSQWLDLLASYGVMTLPFGLFLVLAWRFCRSQLSAPVVDAIRRSWLFFVVLGLFNTVLFSTIVLTWMFLLPSVAGWFARTTSITPRSETGGASR